MPQKGYFTQGVALLLKAAPTLEALEQILGHFGPTRRTSPAPHWAIGGSGLSLRLPHDLPGGGEQGPGLLIADILDRPWPDDMGDPQTAPELFNAWGTAHFGPYCWPRSLERALECAWFVENAKTAVPAHQACVRLRITYLNRADDKAQMFPEGYDAHLELQILADVIGALFDLPGTICYFNPGGELLMERGPFLDKLAFDRQKKILPADLFCNIRVVPLPDNAMLVDTVGLDQFDLTDQEAVFPRGKVRPEEAANFLFSVAHFLNAKGDLIRNNHSMDSSREMRWIAHPMTEALLAPPRETLRWIPQQWQQPPVSAFDPSKVDEEG